MSRTRSHLFTNNQKFQFFQKKRRASVFFLLFLLWYCMEHIIIKNTENSRNIVIFLEI